MVHEQQEPREKKERNLEIFLLAILNIFFLKDWNHKLQIILVTADKNLNSKNIFFFSFFSFDERIYAAWFSFFYRADLDSLFHLLSEH